MNIPVSYWRIIWLPWSPVCMALKSTWICMLSPIASRPLSGVTKNGSCTNSWNFASLLPMFRTRRVLVVAYWEDTTITWWVVPRNLDVLANFLCNEYQSITNTAHICVHKFGNNEHVAKIVIFQFWIFKRQSSHLSNLWISLFNGKQHHIHSCNTLNVQLHVVRVINGKLRNNNQNALTIYLYRTSSKADLIWKVKDGSCPNCFYWHQEFLPFSDANKLMGIVLLKE